MYINNNNNTNGTRQSEPAYSGAFGTLSPAQNRTMPAPPQMLAPAPDPQVRPQATRRKFTTSYKLAILAEVDACSEFGQIGTLLRREGLYSSTLANFRKQRDAGRLQSGKSEEQKKDQRRKTLTDQQRDRRRLAALEKENRKLHMIIDFQKKLSEILEISLDTPELLALREGVE